MLRSVKQSKKSRKVKAKRKKKKRKEILTDNRLCIVGTCDTQSVSFGFADNKLWYGSGEGKIPMSDQTLFSVYSLISISLNHLKVVFWSGTFFFLLRFS